jgi:hypothetical protein
MTMDIFKVHLWNNEAGVSKIIKRATGNLRLGPGDGKNSHWGDLHAHHVRPDGGLHRNPGT